MTILLHGAAALLFALAALAGQAAPGTPPGETAPIIQNERVAVWDYTWARGTPSPIGRRDEDCVIVYITATDGRAVFQPKGVVAPEPPGLDGPMWRAKVIALHDHPEAPRRNTSGFPNGFPRPGARAILDNARVVVWDYTFKEGSPSAMHFHDKDVVVTYIGAGALKSTTADGQETDNNYVFGDTRFNLGNRTHSELLTRGNLRIFAMELK